MEHHVEICLKCVWAFTLCFTLCFTCDSTTQSIVWHPLRSLVPARFICLSTMLKRKCREGLDTVTRKKPFRREARAFRFSSIADKAGTWHGHTETIRNPARSGVKDSKHIEKRWNTYIYIYFLFSFLEDKSDTLQIRTCRLMLCPSESFFSLDEATCRFSVWQRSSRAASCIGHHCTHRKTQQKCSHTGHTSQILSRCPAPASLTARPQDGFISISPSNTWHTSSTPAIPFYPRCIIANPKAGCVKIKWKSESHCLTNYQIESKNFKGF